MLDIEKFKLLEKIKISYLSHRGDVLKVAKELNLPLDYVRSRTAKIKRAEERNVRTLIADTLMSYIFLGHQSRIYHLQNMLERLDNKEVVLVSVCHSFVYRVEDRQGVNTNICLKCNTVTALYEVTQALTIDLRLRIIEALREEDRALVSFGAEMGYTQREEPPMVKYEDKRQYLVLGQNENLKGVGKQDSMLLQDAQKLSPMDRERLIKELEKKINDTVQG